ncbi:hypothetical protein BG003_009588 [Podila horticola]|nr:hypothetical protein BG003_009588 [Podila horticola]
MPLISEASSFPRSERSSPAGNSNNVKNAIPDPKAILKKPGVRITGAGIGGLTTVLCEKAGIEYFVIDSATKVNPLSKSPAMMKFSFLIDFMDMYEKSLKRIGSIDDKPFNEM